MDAIGHDYGDLSAPPLMPVDRAYSIDPRVAPFARDLAANYWRLTGHDVAWETAAPRERGHFLTMAVEHLAAHDALRAVADKLKSLEQVHGATDSDHGLDARVIVLAREIARRRQSLMADGAPDFDRAPAAQQRYLIEFAALALASRDAVAAIKL